MFNSFLHEMSAERGLVRSPQGFLYLHAAGFHRNDVSLFPTYRLNEALR